MTPNELIHTLREGNLPHGELHGRGSFRIGKANQVTQFSFVLPRHLVGLFNKPPKAEACWSDRSWV